MYVKKNSKEGGAHDYYLIYLIFMMLSFSEILTLDRAVVPTLDRLSDQSKNQGVGESNH